MTIKDISCPECDHRLKFGAHPHQGQRIICSLCETSLTITSLNPVELDLMTTRNQAVSTKQRAHTSEVPCPECEDSLRINPHTGQGYRVRCKSCDAILEVASSPSPAKWSGNRGQDRNREYRY